jgi:hypothetical protein
MSKMLAAREAGVAGFVVVVHQVQLGRAAVDFDFVAVSAVVVAPVVNHIVAVVHHGRGIVRPGAVEADGPAVVVGH